MKRRKYRRISWLVFGAAVAFILVALNFETIRFASDILSAEKRPYLLRDATWNDPDSAQRFQSEFGAGTDEVKLLGWLKRNRFDIDRSARRAVRLIESFPCHERVVVTWATDSQSRLQASKATVSENGCL